MCNVTIDETQICSFVDEFKNLKPKEEVDEQKHNELVQEESETPSETSESESENG